MSWLAALAGFFCTTGLFGAEAALDAAFADAGFLGAAGRFAVAGFLAAVDWGVLATVGCVPDLVLAMRFASGFVGAGSAMPGAGTGPDGGGLSLSPANGAASGIAGDTAVGIAGDGAGADAAAGGGAVGAAASSGLNAEPDARCGAGPVGAGCATVLAVDDGSRGFLDLLAALASPSKMPLMMLNMLPPKNEWLDGGAALWLPAVRMYPAKVILFDFAFVCRVCKLSMPDDKRLK